MFWLVKHLELQADLVNTKVHDRHTILPKKGQPTPNKLFMDLLTSLMHRYCTNPAPITSQDTLILSHSFNLRLAQTLFIFPFFLMLYQFGIVYHTPLFHYL